MASFEAINNDGAFVNVSDSMAVILLAGACRDTSESINSLKSNPFGQMKTNNGGLIRYNPNKAGE